MRIYLCRQYGRELSTLHGVYRSRIDRVESAIHKDYAPQSVLIVLQIKERRAEAILSMYLRKRCLEEWIPSVWVPIQISGHCIRV